MVTVKKLYDLDPYVEWMPFLNEVFNPAIRIHRHTQVRFGENIDISLISEQEILENMARRVGVVL